MIEADLVGNLKIVEHAPLKTDHFRDTRFLNPLGRLQIFLYPQFNNLPPLFHQDTRESTLSQPREPCRLPGFVQPHVPNSGRPKPLAAAFAEPLQGEPWPDPIRGPSWEGDQGAGAD